MPICAHNVYIKNTSIECMRSLRTDKYLKCMKTIMEMMVDYQLQCTLRAYTSLSFYFVLLSSEQFPLDNIFSLV